MNFNSFKELFDYSKRCKVCKISNNKHEISWLKIDDKYAVLSNGDVTSYINKIYGLNNGISSIPISFLLETKYYILDNAASHICYFDPLKHTNYISFNENLIFDSNVEISNLELKINSRCDICFSESISNINYLLNQFKIESERLKYDNNWLLLDHNKCNLKLFDKSLGVKYKEQIIMHDLDPASIGAELQLDWQTDYDQILLDNKDKIFKFLERNSKFAILA